MTNRRTLYTSDIGCGKGLFLQRMAELHPDWELSGVRNSQTGGRTGPADGLRTWGWLISTSCFATSNISFPALMTSLGNPNPLQQVSNFSFPTRWFKKSATRNAGVAATWFSGMTVATFLPQGGKGVLTVVLQSDVEAVRGGNVRSHG